MLVRDISKLLFKYRCKVPPEVRNAVELRLAEANLRNFGTIDGLSNEAIRQLRHAAAMLACYAERLEITLASTGWFPAARAMIEEARGIAHPDPIKHPGRWPRKR